MTKPIIAFDLDDVLADSTESLRLEINKRTGANIQPEDYRQPGDYWRYYERVWEAHNISHLISIPDLDAQMVRDQSGILAHAAALDVLHGLADTYELVVVTARDDNQKPETDKWLRRNFPGMFSRVVFANGSKGIAVKNKGQICKELGAAWLVDDSPAHCKDAIDQGITALLFGEFGWHQNVPEQAVICKDWKAVKEYFDGR